MNLSSSGQRQLQKPRLLQLLVWNGLEPFKLPRLSLDAIRAQGFFEGFKPGGPRRRKDVRFYIRGEQAEPGPNPHTRLSLDAIRAPGFLGRFKPGGPRRRKDVRLYILGEQAEPGPNPRTRLFERLKLCGPRRKPHKKRGSERTARCLLFLGFICAAAYASVPSFAIFTISPTPSSTMVGR